jgi:hypothetical protein
VPSRPSFLLAMLAEFRRAAAAAQRYEDLRYRSAGTGRIAPGDLPRQVFEEFYSVEKPPEVAPVQPASSHSVEWPMLRRRRGVA